MAQITTPDIEGTVGMDGVQTRFRGEHTQGPWDGSHHQKIECRISGFYHIVQAGKDRAALAYACNKADARLIAAAPDLLAALKRCEATVSTETGPPDWDWVREVIAKAESQT